MWKIVAFAVALGIAQFSWAQENGLSPSDIVATRGGVNLTVDLVDEEVGKMPEDVRSGYFDDPALVARMIDSLLLTKQLAAEAQRQGITRGDVNDKADGELDHLNALANELLRRKVEGDGTVDYAALAEDRYRARRKSYATQEYFVLRYLFVDATDHGMVAAKMIAEVARSRALAGEDFASLVKDYDDDGSAGKEFTLSLNELTGNAMLREAVGKIGNRSGGISDVVESGDGARVVQLVEYRPSQVPPYEDVRESIIDQLKQEVFIGTRTTYMRAFSLQDVVVNGDVVKKLPERYQRSDSDDGVLN